MTMNNEFANYVVISLVDKVAQKQDAIRDSTVPKRDEMTFTLFPDFVAVAYFDLFTPQRRHSNFRVKCHMFPSADSRVAGWWIEARGSDGRRKGLKVAFDGRCFARAVF
ncbi:hypothetical protein E4U50_004646 [Claviceps purpurea]|nr:hypothetical protein E4U50_004646 [Claviceps purpurea]